MCGTPYADDSTSGLNVSKPESNTSKTWRFCVVKIIIRPSFISTQYCIHQQRGSLSSDRMVDQK